MFDFLLLNHHGIFVYSLAVFVLAVLGDNLTMVPQTGFVESAGSFVRIFYPLLLRLGSFALPWLRHSPPSLIFPAAVNPFFFWALISYSFSPWLTLFFFWTLVPFPQPLFFTIFVHPERLSAPSPCWTHALSPSFSGSLSLVTGFPHIYLCF